MGWLAVVSAVLGIPLGASFVHAETLAPGIESTPTEQSCTATGQTVRYYEIRWASPQTAELQVIRNPEVQVIGGRCPYQGKTLPELIQDWSLPVIAATNGTIFGAYDPPQGPFPGFRSKGMIWTKRAGFLAPLRTAATGLNGGENFVILTAQDSKVLDLVSFCGGDCPLTLADTEKLIHARFPEAEVILQFNMPLHKTEQMKCPPDSPGSWKCKSAPRTVLCLRENGSMSLFTFRSILPHRMAIALKPGEACALNCKYAFNLDGGGSTQIGVQDPMTLAWTMLYGKQAEGCPAYRPVENYMVLLRREMPAHDPTPNLDSTDPTSL